ncbi:pyridoxal-dependent decarboxylase, exosortase A system-associated, partial [Pelomonas sp. HMWF004]
MPKRALEHAPLLFTRDARGELLVGGQRLSVLAERVGQTPFYAYDRSLLRDRVAELRAALPAGIELHYA